MYVKLQWFYNRFEDFSKTSTFTPNVVLSSLEKSLQVHLTGIEWTYANISFQMCCECNPFITTSFTIETWTLRQWNLASWTFFSNSGFYIFKSYKEFNQSQVDTYPLKFWQCYVLYGFIQWHKISRLLAWMVSTHDPRIRTHMSLWIWIEPPKHTRLDSLQSRV